MISFSISHKKYSDVIVLYSSLAISHFTQSSHKVVASSCSNLVNMGLKLGFVLILYQLSVIIERDHVQVIKHFSLFMHLS